MTDLFLEGKTFSHIPTSLAQGSGAGDGAGRGEEQPCCLGPRLWAVPSVLSPFPVPLPCWPETNRLPEYAQSTFWISGEFNFGVCSHGVQAPICQRKESFVDGERNWNWEVYGKWSVWLFIVWVPPCQERGLFPVGLYDHHKAWQLPPLVSWLFNWGFCWLIYC